MKTIKLLAIGLLSVLSYCIQAQDSELLRRFNKEISVDLISLLPENNSTAYLRYRVTGKKLQKKNKKIIGTTRVTLNLRCNYRRNTPNTAIGERNAGAISFISKVGREWGIKLKKIQPFYGIDTRLGATFYHLRTEFPGSFINDSDFYLTLNTGLEFFLGLRYFVHPRISITVEASYNAVFNVGSEFFQFTGYMAPLSALTVGYSF